MPNHLTPEELAKETGKDREEVIRICLEEGVPIYHGKIDKTLFQATLEAVGTDDLLRQDVATSYTEVEASLAHGLGLAPRPRLRGSASPRRPSSPRRRSP